MSDRVFTLITVISSGFLGLAVAVITGWLTSRREGRTFRRQLSRDRVEAVRTLYEDGLSAIESLMVNRGVVSEADQATFTRILARLALSSTDEIRKQFEDAAEAARAWGIKRRQVEPQRAGGMLFVSSDIYGHAEEAEKLYPVFHESYLKLRGMMVEHLRLSESRIK